MRFLLCTLLALGSTGYAVAQSSVVEVANSASPAVVGVSVRFERARLRVGPPRDGATAVAVERPASGVILSASGLVLTNAHLVAELPDGPIAEGAEFWLVVGLRNGREYRAEVVARDERVDLALLQLVGARGLTALPLGRLEGRSPGERVVAMALPDARSPHAFAGALAFPGGPVQLRDARLERDEVLISDARFHDLLDGGPLLDGTGQILGIHNSSHISVRPPRFDEEEGEEETEPVDTDYAVIVSAKAIRAAFEKELEGVELPSAPVTDPEAEEATAAIAAIAPCVVGVWADPGTEHPSESDPGDPHARRVPATLGSGVIVDSGGLVLTCADLFEGDGDHEASVRLASGEVHSGEVLKLRRTENVALIRLELPEGTELPAAELADFAEARAGELVAVVGRPYGGALSLSVGVLSARERQGCVQLASWVHPGHWGGALVDRTGRLLGIAVDQPPGTDGVTQESYLGFAAPISKVCEVFEDEWKEHGTVEGGPVVVTSADEEPSAVSRVVQKTHGSLINVLVSANVEKPAAGFDPFAEPERSFQLLGQGSGVIIDESGLALTNWHVVEASLGEDGEQSEDFLVEVTLQDDRKLVARVLSTSRDDDLALIALEVPGGEVLNPVELGNSDAMALGEPVVAIGNPLGLANSVSAGIVSCTAITTRIVGRLRAYEDMLMTDAAINPGNSGGALLDLDGNLIGINSAGRTGAGMAIPVNKAREVFSDKLLSAERLRSSYLGMKVEEGRDGVSVTSVDTTGPAARAGVEAGDRLLRFGDRDVATSIVYTQVQLDAVPGAPLPLRVDRAGEELDLEIVPLSFASWRISRQCGIEVVEVDYGEENELVREASVALHRAFTGNPDSQPAQLMGGALRVTRVSPIDPDRDLDVRKGDLLLGMTTFIRGTTVGRDELVRFERVADLRDAIEPLSTREGGVRELWLLRDGEIVMTEVLVRRPR